ncbi:MAG: YicC/YloC family endoribonuclease [Bacteroidota bacterium]
MQYSMTGYGLDERIVQGIHIRSELKTLNSKFLDFSPKLPRELQMKEADIKNKVSKILQRGKVLLTVEVGAKEDESDDLIQVNEQLFKNYYKKFEVLSASVGQENTELVKLALQAPEVVSTKELSVDEIPLESVDASIDAALEACLRFRENEGTELVSKLAAYANAIENGLDQIKKLDGSRMPRIKNRLESSIQEISDKVSVDQNRFEQELIYYVEKIDITEEKVRLANHLKFFLDVLNNEPSAGKKIGFISQEIGREINTIGSKANDAEMQKVVVEMKDELEKIKEQALNIV